MKKHIAVLESPMSAKILPYPEDGKLGELLERHKLFFSTNIKIIPPDDKFPESLISPYKVFGPFINPEDAKRYILECRLRMLNLMLQSPMTNWRYKNLDKNSVIKEIEKIQKVLNELLNRNPYLFF
jgi:hypothetical protein